MTTQQQRKDPNDLIELSLAPKTYDAGKNVNFDRKEIRFADLEKTLKSHNYSLIKWKDGIRNASNFQYSDGFIIDIDEGLSIPDAEARLQSRNLNYYLIPSKSHTDEHHKYHILLLFSYRVYSKESYGSLAEYIITDLLPECDPAVKDAGRFIFGSPNNVKTSSYLQGENLDVLEHEDIWEKSLKLTKSNGDPVYAIQTDKKTRIYCPFHRDNTPSAFVNYSAKSKNWYISCSACNQTFWMRRPAFESQCDPYWSYGKDIFELGILNDEFFIEKIGKAKFHILTKTHCSPEDKAAAFEYLVDNKHISHISRIDYLGDIEAEESYYNVILDKGIIEVHYAPLQTAKQDNDFIERYLQERFQQYKDFIKEYLAVFCYTNYSKLPTLILKGPRGNGKSTFAEIVGEIYRPLTYEWQGHEENFTYEVEKKLLIVEENESTKMSQYKTLKKYSGQKYAIVNKKFKDPYKVRNNMNIIMLTNEAIPLYVSREEQPKDEFNNQFFVYEFPEIKPPMDPRIQDKILARLGHYIRTELRSVFNSIIDIGYRYSITVPITDAEKALFIDNVTDLEADTDRCLQKLILDHSGEKEGIYSNFIEKNYIPTKYFREDIFLRTHYNRVIKNLKKRGYLTGAQTRIKVADRRQYCFEITQKLKDEIDKAKSQCP